jgi:ankyrin repeat protein
MPPLSIAAAQGYNDILRYLIEKGAKVFKKDKFKRTALIIAIRNCNVEGVELLLKAGCPVDEPDSSDNYPLHYAVAYGCY